MGRKVDFLEKPKKGPGKKVKKQAAPQVPNLPKSNDNKLSSRQKKRLKNRVQKKSERQPPIKPASDEDDEENVSEVSDEESVPANNGFTDDNNEWLKQKKLHQWFLGLQAQNPNSLPVKLFLLMVV